MSLSKQHQLEWTIKNHLLHLWWYPSIKLLYNKPMVLLVLHWKIWHWGLSLKTSYSIWLCFVLHDFLDSNPHAIFPVQHMHQCFNMSREWSLSTWCLVSCFVVSSVLIFSMNLLIKYIKYNMFRWCISVIQTCQLGSNITLGTLTFRQYISWWQVYITYTDRSLKPDIYNTHILIVVLINSNCYKRNVFACAILENIALGYASCYMSFSTPPLVLYFPYSIYTSALSNTL